MLQSITLHLSAIRKYKFYPSHTNVVKNKQKMEICIFKTNTF